VSATYSLACPKTRRYVWIGQGWGSMTTFYTGEPQTMEHLRTFLNAHMGEVLRFVSNDATLLYEGGWEEWLGEDS